MHNVPPGSESHFKVVLVSSEFEDKMPVKRHQLVYKILSEEMQGGIHALALHTYTPTEWEHRLGQAPNSPDCKGGSKVH
jgi:BolA protein